MYCQCYCRYAFVGSRNVETVLVFDGVNSMENLSWNHIYSLWQTCSLFGDVDRPVPVETIPVKWYNSNENIHGYDWLSNRGAEVQRNHFVQNDGYFDLLRVSLKGTILTAKYLANTESREVRAAIWIAATSHELYRGGCGRSTDAIYRIHLLASTFLAGHSIQWHYSMRKLVPDIFVWRHFNDDLLVAKDYEIINAIVINTAALLSTYRILLYISHKEDVQFRVI